MTQNTNSNTGKEVLNAAKYYVDGGDFQRTHDFGEIYVRKMIKGEAFDVCNMGCNESDDPYQEALEIRNALQNTYGKGYDPTKVDELYKALSQCFIQLEKYTVLDDWDTADDEAYEAAKDALKNAKINQP